MNATTETPMTPSAPCPASWRYVGLHITWNLSCGLTTNHDVHYDADASRAWSD